MQDAAITEITSNPNLYAEYLNLQGDNPTYSPGNIAMVIGQLEYKGGVIKIGTAERWTTLGRRVLDSEKQHGMMIFARSKNYRGYDLTPVYDLEQTSGRPLKEITLVEGSEKMETALATLLNYSVVPVEINSTMQVAAYYDDQNLTLAINPDFSDHETFAALATEIALSRMHGKGRIRDFNREDFQLDAESISYILCRRFGIEHPLPDAKNIAALYDGYNSQERRTSLDQIQDMCKQIGNNIERSIEPPQKTRATGRGAI